MKKTARTAKLVCSILLIFFGSRTVVLSDATKDLADAINEANEAQAKATANAPTQPTVKGREDTLDRAIRNNEQTQADANAGAVEKTAAQEAEDTARAQADAARRMTNNPDGAEAYRKALARRRAARKRLKEVREQLRKMLPGAINRPEVVQKIREADRGIGQTERVPPLPTPTPTETSSATLPKLVSSGQLAIALAGTGKTIGTVANLQLANKTDKPLQLTVPPLLLISSTAKSQNYACPIPQTVTVAANQTQAVPLTGACLNRSKPPVGDGVGGELIAQGIEGVPLNQASGPKESGQSIPTISQAHTAKLLTTAGCYYKAAEKLEKGGAFKDMPYSSPKQRKEIVVQWGIWSDPKLAELSGEKPATKEDLAKTVYKQAGKPEAMTPEKKKKIDQGINEIFENIELTSKEAKDLDEESFPESIELTTEKAKDV